MKAASINEIKQELKNIQANELTELCIRLAKYKKENKELLHFLLFESYDLNGYIDNVKKEVTDQFKEINRTNIYFTKKSLRKILRATNKYIRYTGSKQAEAELVTFFCTTLKTSGIPIHRSTALTNLYKNQLKKINKVVQTLHEDLQYDYLKILEELK